MAGKGPINDVWVDLPGYIAAAHAYLGDKVQAENYMNRFRSAFREKISSEKEPTSRDMRQWFQTANPFKRAEDNAHILDGLALAGLHDDGAPGSGRAPHPPVDAFSKAANIFKKEHELWQMSFEGTTVALTEVKGYLDLVRLLADPGRELHCMEIMGGADGSGGDEPVLDPKARSAYRQRLQELRSEIDEAGEMNDLARHEALSAELDQITEHLAGAMGLGGRSRQLNPPVERARAAVTWRIRSAIKKIEAAHPALGRHLANSIRTGVFCCYSPETERLWRL